MQRALLVIGSAIFVTVVSFAPAAACFLWLHKRTPSNDGGMEGLLCVIAVFPGVPIMYLIAVALLGAMGWKSEPQLARAVLLGALLPLVLAGLAFGVAVFYNDIVDQSERADEIADHIQDEFVGETISSETRPWTVRLEGCGNLDQWTAERIIELSGDPVLRVRQLQGELDRGGWQHGLMRTADPLLTRERWSIGASKADEYLDAKFDMFEAGTVMTLRTMVGPCAETNGLDLLAKNRPPGVPLEPVVEAPSFVGTQRTAVDTAWWAPSELRPQGYLGPECGAGNGPASGLASSPWLSDELDDPLVFGNEWLIDMRSSLEAEGWETEAWGRREYDSYDENYAERRMVRAHRDDTLVLFTADFRILGGPPRPHVEIGTELFHGPCVGELGLTIGRTLGSDSGKLRELTPVKPLES